MKRFRLGLFALAFSSPLVAFVHGCGGDDTSSSTDGGSSDGNANDVTLADGSADASDAARPEPTIAIFPGSTFDCATKAGGLECWGDDTYGQQANGSCTSTAGTINTVTTLGLSPSFVGAGYAHACASDGTTTKCWGSNTFWQLGHDPATDTDAGASCTSPNAAVPAEVAGLGTVTSVAIGYSTSCALVSGQAVCWGRSESGESGDAPDGAAGFLPQTISGTDGAVELAFESGFGCVRKGDGSVWCWGDNSVGELAQAVDAVPHPSATQVALGGNAIQVAVARSGYFACTVMDDHTVKCWGYNGGYGNGPGGALGHDPATDPDCLGACSTTPTAVGGLSNVRELGLGYKHACAVLETNNVMCWGENKFGELGHDPSVDLDGGMNTGSYTFTPTAVTGLANIAHVYGTEQDMTCAVTWDSKVYCWGSTASFPMDAGVAQSFIPLPVSL